MRAWWRGVLYPIAFVGFIHGREDWLVLPRWSLLGPGWCALVGIAVFEFLTFFVPPRPVDALQRAALVACVMACMYRPLEVVAKRIRWSFEASSPMSVLDDYHDQFEPVRLILLALCAVALLFSTWLLPPRVLARVQSAASFPTLVVLATWPR